MPIAKLAADLTALVDQLELDRCKRRIIPRQTADELHELRERAEQLFAHLEQAR